MQVDVLLGLQWGDEGKGKIVDYLAPKYNIVARFQGGPNAGHTLVIDGDTHVLHTIPSGIFIDGITNVIGNGVVIDPVTLSKELDKVETVGVDPKKSILVSNKAHLILPTHRILDAASEAAKGKKKIGSTLRGIGPTYMDKTGRNGIRVGDILEPDFLQRYDQLKEKHLRLLAMYDFAFDVESMEADFFAGIDRLRSLPISNTEYYINDSLTDGKKVLAEGAQGSLLDIDHGTYPYVTSSHTTSTGVCSGLGVAPNTIKDVIGICKAYVTRVGSGPFPTELHDEDGEKLRVDGHEFGSTTGRPRRTGWLDIPALIYAIMLNGVTQIALTKADVLNNFETIKVANSYSINNTETKQLPFELSNPSLHPNYTSMKGWQTNFGDCKTFDDLPTELQDYITHIEKETKVGIPLLSSGPGREEIIEIQNR